MNVTVFEVTNRVSLYNTITDGISIIGLKLRTVLLSFTWPQVGNRTI